MVISFHFNNTTLQVQLFPASLSVFDLNFPEFVHEGSVFHKAIKIWTVLESLHSDSCVARTRLCLNVKAFA